MASALALLIHSSLLALFLCYYSPTVHGRPGQRHHVVRNDSLTPPSPPCSPPQGPGRAWIMLTHQYGPCSSITTEKQPTVREILRQDQLRVNRLQARARAAFNKGLNQSQVQDSEVSLPAHGGAALNSGNFVVTVGLGTPSQAQTVILDTGSDVCWVQCQPCPNCYRQQDPIYDPSQSSSYKAIPCNSECSQLESSGCSDSECSYHVGYGDNSSTDGVYSHEALTLSATDVFQDFVFGCGQSNQGIFGEVAGLFGLGRGPASLVLQTTQKYGSVFSYCLPPVSSSTGYLAFGEPGSGDNAAISYTPMVTDNNHPIFYFVNLIGISVGGQQLSIDPTVFSSTGTILDSGTVITRLPPSAYEALKSAFQGFMTDYPAAAPHRLLDTCYDFSGSNNPAVPSVVLHFDGEVSLELGYSGVIYNSCLAFAAANNGHIGIIGNVQQGGFEVVYDLGNERIGFRPGACS